MIKRKAILVVSLALAAYLSLLLHSSTAVRNTWWGLPPHIGIGEHGGESQAPEHSNSGHKSTNGQHYSDYASWKSETKFRSGSAMPSGHNYTSVLVLAKTKEEDISWTNREIPEQEKAVYVVDDLTAPLHPPRNKGHEVMVYLSWIIDNYPKLPDIAIFMHAHQYTWHNDDMLENDAAKLVVRLSRQHVWRNGYVNMRCSWYPGCPDWMHPGETEENASKPEEVHLSKSWGELFPTEEVPSVLAQPCCAQFALSRERIEAIPYAQYVRYREWLLSTKLPDTLSGRVWEYVWQFIFTGGNTYCPKEHICFCDQFGICFNGEAEYNHFVSIKNELSDRERDLKDWNDKKEAIEKAIEKVKEEGSFEKADQLEKPESGKNVEFKKEIDRLRRILDGLKREAEEQGKDSKDKT